MLVEFLTKIDTILFIFFNIHLANRFFDLVMPVVTYKETWYPLWVVLTVGLLWKGGKKGRWVVLIAILSVALADQMVNQIFKPLFQRVRPCNIVDGVHLLVKKTSSYSLPSSHAANFFAVATVFTYFYRKYQLVFWFIAGLVSYSRVAVGVHYPFDILVGAILGILFAGFWILLYRKILKIKDQAALMSG